MDKPERKFKAGAITATVWRNESDKGTFQTIQISRNYKDARGEWKNSSSLRVTDIPKATLVLQKAYEHIVMNDEVPVEVVV